MHTPRRNLQPLGAALAVAVVVGAAGVVTARLTHRSAGSTAQRAVATPTPAGRPTPSPTPQSVTFAPLFPQDDVSLSAALAYGHLSLTGTDNTLRVDAYKLDAAAPANSPATAPVWRYDHPPASPDTAALATRFGPEAFAGYDPSTGLAGLNSTTAPDISALPHLGSIPRDDAGVGQLADDFLLRYGLRVDGLQSPRAVHFPNSARPDLSTWGVSWDRDIQGSAIVGAGATMTVGQDGVVSNLMVRAVHVAGGSPYPVVSWHQAWSQVAAGHWYAERGGFTGGNGQSSLDRFDATGVQLGYLRQERPVSQTSPTERSYLVPMWVFTDPSASIQLFYPAVASTALTYTWAPRPWPTAH